MFENVGRQLDRWYAFRMLVAAWLLACGVVIGGYAVLGYLFLRFLVWLFFAFLGLFLPVVNPISFEEFLTPIEPVNAYEVELPDDGDIVDWNLDEPAWEIDDELPPLEPEPPPEREEVASVALVEGITNTPLLAKIMSTTDSSDGTVLGVLSGGEGGSLLGVLSGSGAAEGVFAALDRSDEGSSVLGSIGGPETRSPARRVPAGSLTFKRQSMPSDLEAVRCRVMITFDEDGRADRASPMGCPEDLRYQVRKAVGRWRIEPWRQEGAGVPVRTTVNLPISP